MKKYQTPELEFVKIVLNDIITNSITVGGDAGSIDTDNPDNGLIWGQL